MLLVLAQQGGLLHELGHAVAETPSAGAAAKHAPHEPCSLCAGFAQFAGAAMPLVHTPVLRAELSYALLAPRHDGWPSAKPVKAHNRGPPISV